ncbi:MAG: S8 family serine peptidase [Acidobacteriota bacterium]
MKRTKNISTLAIVILLTVFFGGLLGTKLVSGPPEEYVPDKLLVKFQPGTDRSRIDLINERIGAVIESDFRMDPDLFLIRLPEDSDLGRAIDHYLGFTEVKYAEKNWIIHAVVIPNDTSFNILWGMHNTGQSGGKVDADIDAPEAWDTITGDPNLVIASIDTGVNYSHPDLSNNIWTNDDEIQNNGKDDDNNGFIDDYHGWNFAYNNNNPMDDHSHGSHTSGTMAAEGDNGQGVAGVVWSAKVMSVKFLNSYGSGTTDNAVKAVDYATENGARLSNNSWGGGGYSQALYDAIERANQAGSLFVAAAGNNYSNNDYSPFYPASYNNQNILSVAATDRYDNKANFSNYGATTVDVGAPGVDIYSTTLGASYGYMSGTSMASPHAAGVCSLIWAYNPNLTHLDVKDIVMNSVRPIPALSGLTVTGGVVNAQEAIAQTPPAQCPNPDNQAPVANAGGPYNGPMNKNITFNGSGSYDPDGSVKQYRWDFGDGSRASTNKSTITHAYSAEGTYQVTLTVLDDCYTQSSPGTTTARIKGGKK